MKRLCFGIVFKILRCAHAEGFNQEKLFVSIRHIVGDMSGDFDTSNVSSYINGVKPMPRKIGEKALAMNEDSFSRSLKKELLPKLVDRKKAYIVLAIKDLVKAYDEDSQNFTIGFSNRYTAASIISNNEINYADFLTNVLFYVLTQVKNSDFKKDIKAYRPDKEFKKLKNRLSTITFVSEENENSLFSDTNLKANYHDALYIETRAQCPKCSRGLVDKEDSKVIPAGKVVTIDPQKPVDSDNLIMLCPSCANTYESNITKEKIEEMKETKSRLLESQKARIISDSYDIKDGIELVLKSLPDGKFNFNVRGNMKPIAVQKKLVPGNEDILFEVKNYLSLYKQVEESNKILQESGAYSFEITRQKINCMYKELKNAGRTKKQIYEELIDCLNRNSNGGRAACIAVVTYFIQKCDVFDANTK